MAWKYKVIANMMMRSEPIAAIAVLSIIDYVDKIIIIDTGSTDSTYEEMQQVKKMYPKKVILEQRLLEDGQNWSVTKEGINTNAIPPTTSQALADIRREFLVRSNSIFSWGIDADEVYVDSLAKTVREYIDKDCYGAISLFMPFMDLIQDIKHIRHLHWMGRLFRTNMVSVLGNFPYEQHHNKLTGECLETYSAGVTCVSPNTTDYIWHFESIVKKSRKEFKIIGENHTSLPSAIVKYQDRFPRIKPYLEVK